ncbi:thioredoxin domain-containing protein 16 [Spea bombifrons]|uniref:thioredoxin domain-containing protein 16 n=1 Tax=Spea bombifrons TaxID=233779 RepID=UPI00234A94DA|nr:thioredoxin domain-containing protein 16 [Spea bombifrons]
MPGLIILLVCLNRFLMTLAKHGLQELGTDNYFSALSPGKTSLLYFSKNDSPGNRIFLEELQKSAAALQDYGISVARVKCADEDAPKYCVEENAYLFRGTKLLREFPTDALFSVNAIVANVLFVLLYNEVKYITSLPELHNIENNTKGKRNVVFVYVRAIGTPEHRSVMEAAFVYGSMYQFVLTTEAALLEDLSPGESSFVPAKLAYGHCKAVKSLTQKCQRTLLDEPVTTLSIHRFLKLMDAPLLAEASGDPDKFSSIQLQLGLPMVFIISRQETLEADRSTAEHLAWQLLGKAGLAIIERKASDVHIPLNANVALKRADESEPVQYMKLEDTKDIIDLIENSKNQENEESEEKSIHEDQETQDDEVAGAVYEDRKRVLAVHLVAELTDETFKAVVDSKRHSVVLFYAGWEAVSMTFLRSFLEMAEKYNNTLDVYLARVDCSDWPYVCSDENVTSIPVAKIYQMGKEPYFYTGMMGSEDLAKFISLSKLDCPLNLSSMEEVENYLNGKLHKSRHPHQNLSALGIFSPSMKNEIATFMDAGKSLRGFASVGIYSGDHSSVLSDRYSVSPPAIVFSRSNHNEVYGVSLQNYGAKDIIHLIRRELLGVFPEITVENFPSFSTRQKPLLVLFSDGNLEPTDEKHILRLVKGKYLEPYLTGWLNIRSTPAGNAVLKRYFGFIPSLPLLAIIHFDATGHVFAFPSDQQLTEVSILYWLEMVKAGEEVPVYTLSKDEWKPRFPDYDFLAMMDAADPHIAAQKIRIRMKSGKRKKIEVPSARAEKDEHLSKASLRGTAPKILQKEKNHQTHSDL